MNFSNTPSLYSFPRIEISEEDFKLFHSIDRKLFSHLVVGLGRDPIESMQLMAFWLWLEHAGNDMLLVNDVLSLPSQLVNEVADETVVCLKWVKNEHFPFLDVELTLLPNVAKKNNLISPTYLHHNWINVLLGVKKCMNKVCFRAFDDILVLMAAQTTVSRPAQVGSTYEAGECSLNVMDGQLMAPTHPSYYPSLVRYYPNAWYVPTLGKMSFPQAVSADRPLVVTRPSKVGSPPLVGAANYEVGEAADQLPPPVTNEMLEMFNRTIRIVEGDKGEEVVHPDDRTIFLTFSKGYPISEQEVTEFFSRKFGDNIEAIYMQEVASGEQVPYARLVARSLDALDAIVASGKAKHNINGKHVWARKYVKKQSSKYSSSSSPPLSTAAALAFSKS